MILNSPTYLIYKNSQAEKPELIHTTGYCATCAVAITEGLPVKELSGDAYSRQDDFLRFGGHVCEACAWMYSSPKSSQRNVIATESQVWWPMISAESCTDDRPQWYRVILEIAALPDNTQIAGVLTSDPKPRLWPMMQTTTRGNFGLYVHSGDYDVSEFRMFNIDTMLGFAVLMAEILREGFTKKEIFHSLLNSSKAQKAMKQTLLYEKRLKTMRDSPAFLPALLIAHKGIAL